MKDIKGYEGLYAVTEEGQVWSYRSNKFLKSNPDKDGYLKIGLYKEKNRKYFFLHRLVAEAYIPNPENKPQVNHKDENKQNNNINNLEWFTVKENINYGTRNIKTQKALSKPIYCVELDRVFEGAAAAARELNLNRSGITKVCRHQLKTTGGYHWRYVE